MSCIDHDRHEMARTYAWLSQYPSVQEEAIVRHYSSLAALAFDLRELMRKREYGGMSPQLNDLIARQVTMIKDAHRRDLGLTLEWPAPESS